MHMRTPKYRLLLLKQQTKNPKPPSKWKACGSEGQNLNVCVVVFYCNCKSDFCNTFYKVVAVCWFFSSLQISFLQNPYLKRKDVESFGNVGRFIKQRAANGPWTDAFFSRFDSWSESAWSKAKGLEVDSKSAEILRGEMLLLVLPSLLEVYWVTPAFHQGKCLKNSSFYFNF